MNKKPLSYSKPPPPPRKGGPKVGYIKPFVELLQRHPDEWFQFRPGVAHDASRSKRIRDALPGVIVTTRRWVRPKGPYSRKRTKTTRCDIYAVWPSIPGVAPEFRERHFTDEDAAEMMVEIPPPKMSARVDEPDPDFRWEDFQ